MFGRRNHIRELRSEFAGLLEEAKRLLGREQADLIRAHYNVLHHQRQIEVVQERIANYERSLAEAERIMREREGGKAATKGAAGSGRLDGREGGSQGGSFPRYPAGSEPDNGSAQAAALSPQPG